MGELLTLWTIRVGAALYLAVLLILLRRPGNPARLKLARQLWTVGFGLYVAHVLYAFEFIHHWNHAAAYADTARRTRETVGLTWGGGIYVNYLFGIVWGLDVLWWWRDRAGYEQRPRWTAGAIHAFLLFIMFNACVVFAPRPMLWWGLAGTGVLLLAVGSSWTLESVAVSDQPSAISEPD